MFEELQAEVNLIENLPLELFLELTTKVAVPPAVTVRVAGVNSRLVRPSGWVTVIVSAAVPVTVIVAVLPPFFRIEMVAGLIEKTLQPDGGELGVVPPLAPHVEHGSSQGADVLPDIIADDEMSFVGLTAV